MRNSLRLLGLYGSNGIKLSPSQKYLVKPRQINLFRNDTECPMLIRDNGTSNECTRSINLPHVGHILPTLTLSDSFIAW